MIRTKKLFTTLLITLSILLTSISGVFASSMTHDQYVSSLKKKMINAAEYIYNGKTFTLDNAVDFLTYVRSGHVITEKEKNTFLSSVKESLDKNDAKLKVTNYVYNYETKNYDVVVSEDLGAYGATILLLQAFDLDPQNFEGYNILNSFEEIDLQSDQSHPYYYRVAIEAARTDFKKKLADSMIEKYYVLGSGYNYWGYCSDNNAMFLTSLASISSKYNIYIKDVKKLIHNNEEKKGLISNPDWDDNPCSDSTALAMMAFAANKDFDQAKKYYNQLKDNYEVDSGIYGFQDNEEKNALSTKNALISLYYYVSLYNDETVERTASSSAVVTLNSNHKKVAYTNKSIKKTTITLPSTTKVNGITYTVSKLNKDAFYNGVKSVILPSNITVIHSQTFLNDKKLTSIKVNSSSLYFSKNAFKGLSHSQLKKMRVTFTKKMSNKQYQSLKKQLIKLGLKSSNIIRK